MSTLNPFSDLIPCPRAPGQSAGHFLATKLSSEQQTSDLHHGINVSNVQKCIMQTNLTVFVSFACAGGHRGEVPPLSPGQCLPEHTHTHGFT